ncbi:hypothetical protein LG943_12695 [Streptomonospora sp. S1-112]|uniref:Uncharacterized protein n=1 Tax=Streptomonospora mangrovi TaxID=2883123 RepID=A0A9X3SEP2_9ACTN|nr:hypothetical protein [Streptomonospora mangrovi]MDA0565167.1 hypothetical protein [Streptomonospora mangrovi]
MVTPHKGGYTPVPLSEVNAAMRVITDLFHVHRTIAVSPDRSIRPRPVGMGPSRYGVYLIYDCEADDEHMALGVLRAALDLLGPDVLTGWKPYVWKVVERRPRASGPNSGS